MVKISANFSSFAILKNAFVSKDLRNDFYKDPVQNNVKKLKKILDISNLVLSPNLKTLVSKEDILGFGS